jgi:hypothetical protein
MLVLKMFKNQILQTYIQMPQNKTVIFIILVIVENNKNKEI